MGTCWSILLNATQKKPVHQHWYWSSGSQNRKQSYCRIFSKTHLFKLLQHLTLHKLGISELLHWYFFEMAMKSDTIGFLCVQPNHAGNGTCTRLHQNVVCARGCDVIFAACCVSDGYKVYNIAETDSMRLDKMHIFKNEDAQQVIRNTYVVIVYWFEIIRKVSTISPSISFGLWV